MADVLTQPGTVNAVPASVSAPVLPAPPIIAPGEKFAEKYTLPENLQPQPAPQPVKYVPTPAELQTAETAPAPAPVKYTPTAEELSTAETQAPRVFPLKDFSVEQLVQAAKDDPENFDPVTLFKQSPVEVKSDPAMFDKVADAYNRLSQTGFYVPSAGKMAKNTAKGIWDLAKTGAYYVRSAAQLPVTLPTAAVAIGTGGDRVPDNSTFGGALTEIQRRESGEYLAGQESAGLGLGQMGFKASRWAARHLGLAKDLKDYTPQEKALALSDELATRSGMEKIATEGIDTGVAKHLAGENLPLRPEEVESYASGSPFAYKAFGTAFGAAGGALKAVTPGVVKAGLTAAGEKISQGTALGTGQLVQGIGKVGEVASTGVEKAAPVTGKVTGAVGGAVAGEHVAGPGGAIFGAIEGLEKGGKVGEKVATGAEKVAGKFRTLQDIGKEIAGQKAVTSGISQFGKDVAQGAPGAALQVGMGVGLDLGLQTVTAETPAEKEGLTPFGTVLGVLGAGHSIARRTLSGQIVGPRDWGSDKRMPSTSNFPGLAGLHDSAYTAEAPGVRRRINALREFGKGVDPNAEIFYVPRPEDGQPDPLREAFKQLGLPEDWANQNGVTPLGEIPGADGKGHQILVFRDVDAGPHEAVHAMDNVIGSAKVQELNAAAKTQYGKLWDAFTQHYANQLLGGQKSADPAATILSMSGHGDAFAKEKIINRVAADLGESGVTPTDQQIHDAAEPVLQQHITAAADRGTTLWESELTPAEQQHVLDQYIGNEIRAENGDAWFKAGQDPKTLGGKMWQAAANVVSMFGGNPVEGRTSQAQGLPLDYGTIRGTANEIKANQTPPAKPVILPKVTAAPGTPQHAEQKDNQQSKIAASAPDVKLPGTSKSQREMMGILNEARTSGTPVAIQYGHAGGSAPAAGAGMPPEPILGAVSRADRRDFIEAWRALPVDTRSFMSTLFSPEEFKVTKGGKYQVYGGSHAVLAANAQKLATFALAHPEFSLPKGLELDPAAKSFTPESWKFLLDRVQDYSANQLSGRTGSGQPLVVPRMKGYFAPPEIGSAKGIPQDVADVINAIYGQHTPETARISKPDVLPLNIAGQRVSEATMPGRVESPTADSPVFGENSVEAEKKAARLGIKGEHVLEPNPFLQKLNAYPDAPSFIEARQRLNLEHMADVEHAPAGAPALRGNTLTLAAGFSPAVAEPGARVTGEEWKKSGLAFKDFFSKATRGETGTSEVPWTPLAPLPDKEAWLAEAAKHTGNFDEHIAKSIPGFRETQVRTGDAVAQTYGETGANVLDIGASEGSWGKTISALTDGKVQTVSLDPNPDMARFFDQKSEVPGATYDDRAFLNGFTDSGKEVPKFEPTQKFDVVHESMAFQFISPEREAQIAEVKRMMAPDGVFLTEEKTQTKQWKENEAQKDADYKSKYFSEDALREKNKTVGFQQSQQETKAVGMLDNMRSDRDLEEILGSQFKHVYQYWDSGNFKGYAASDDLGKLKTLVGNIGDTSTEFSRFPTPRRVPQSVGTSNVQFQPKTPVEIEGPNGEKYKATFDGYQDMRILGRGMIPQFTAVDDIPGVVKAKSTTYGPSLTGKGYKLPEVPAPADVKPGQFAPRYVGIVDNGAPQMRPEGKVDWEKLGPAMHSDYGWDSKHSKWAYWPEDNRVSWWHTPSDEDRFAVENYLDKKGLPVERHTRALTRETIALPGEPLRDEAAQFAPAGEAGARPSRKEVAEARREWKEKGTESPFFKRWFGASVVRDEDGNPKVVYHGTTHAFKAFSNDRANIENDLGAGHYFSDDSGDANMNYADIGPDLRNRIEQRTDSLVSAGMDRDKAKVKATRELVGKSPRVVEAYLKLENPVVLDEKGGTRFDYEYDEASGSEAGPAVDLYQSLLRVGVEMGISGQDVWNKITENGIEDLTAQKVHAAIKETVLDEGNDPQGRILGSEYARRVFADLGFDGVVLKNAELRYGMGLGDDTTHYVAFRPDQIKSVDNRGTFDPADPRVQFSPKGEQQSLFKTEKREEERTPRNPKKWENMNTEERQAADAANTKNAERYFAIGHGDEGIDGEPSPGDRTWIYNRDNRSVQDVEADKTHGMAFGMARTNSEFRGRYDAEKHIASVAFPPHIRERMEFEPTVDDIPSGVYDALQRRFGKTVRMAAFSPKKADDKMELSHWTHAEGLTELDPTFHGSGLAGAERNRARDYKELFVPRTYFGTSDYLKEPGLGDVRYRAEVRAGKLYDLDNDPKDLYPSSDELEQNGFAPMDRSAALTLYENRIQQAGFEGYISKSNNAVAKFTKTPVKAAAFQTAPGEAKQELLGGGEERPVLSTRQLSEMGSEALRQHFPEALVPNRVRTESGELKDPQVPSEITKAPLVKGLSEDEATDRYADKIVEEHEKWKDYPVYKAGLRWYSEFTPKLKAVFGKHAPIMAELLAATSPNTTPEINFAFAHDALERYKAGHFEQPIKKYLEGVKLLDSDKWQDWFKQNGTGTPTEAAFLDQWVKKHNLQPRQSNGKLYGMHSDAVLQVLARRWLTDARGPKTLNFVKNLLGTGHGATIDVWADRTMRRLGYEGQQDRWRILPQNATGVSDPDFHFSQKAFAKAAKKIGVRPDSLQGGLWFAEKQHWADNGWGRLDLGDFRKEVAKVPMLQAGVKQRLAATEAREQTAQAEQPEFGNLLVEPRPLRP